VGVATRELQRGRSNVGGAAWEERHERCNARGVA